MGPNLTGVPMRRGNRDTDLCRRKIRGRHSEETAIYIPRGAASEETNPAILALRLLASRIIAKYVSVVQATRSVVLCYGNPRKLTQSYNLSGSYQRTVLKFLLCPRYYSNVFHLS